MIRVAMVGLGEIGWGAHLPAILRNPRARLVAAADASEDAREGLRRSMADLEVYASFEELQSAEEIDAVILATPPWVTPALAVRAAQCGLYVLAEKPVATDVAELAVYAVLTEDERARVQIGLTYRHHPALAELRDVVQSGALGGELLVRAHVWDERRDGDERHDRLIERTLEHGSPVIHEGAHLFDWLDFILDARPTVEDAWAVRTRPTLAAPNLMGARLSYPSATALVEVGWLVASMPDFVIDIVGDSGRARLDGPSFRVFTSTGSGERVVEPEGDRTSVSFDIQLERFLALASGEITRAEPGLDDGIRALLTSQAVVDAVGSSMEGKRG